MVCRKEGYVSAYGRKAPSAVNVGKLKHHLERQIPSHAFAEKRAKYFVYRGMCRKGKR